MSNELPNQSEINITALIPEKTSSTNPLQLTPVDEELSKFKNELLEIISQKEAALSQKIIKIESAQTDSELKTIEQLKTVQSQYDQILKNSASLHNRLDRLNNYEQFVHKTNDSLISHEIRINNTAKDLTKSVQKYDKIFLDNLLLPGYIGEHCKYKNVKEFYHDLLAQLSTLNTFKEKQTLDLKQYKDRLETLIKQFNLQVENNLKSNMKYCNETCEKFEKNINLKFDDTNQKVFELRLENSKYAIELKAKSLDLSKEWEKMKKIKEEINKRFDDKVSEMVKLNDNTVKAFEESKNDFLKVKRKFYELAEFIKDVRFRKNLGGDVKKREIKTLVGKISFKRKNSFDNHNEDFLSSSKNRANHFKARHSISVLRQSQSVEVKKHNKYENELSTSKKEKERHKNRSAEQEQNDSIDDELNEIVRKVTQDKKDDDFTEYQTGDNLTNYSTVNYNTGSYNSNKDGNGNNKRYNDIIVETNDKIIHEIAAELEQSATKIEKIKTKRPLIEKDSEQQSRKSPEKSSGDKQREEHSPILNFRNQIRSLSNETKKCNPNYIFDMKKEQKELDKKMNQFGKKITDLEIYTKQKILELSYQIENMKETPNPNINTRLIRELKEIKENDHKATKKPKTPAIIEIGGAKLFPNSNAPSNTPNQDLLNITLNQIRSKKISNRIKTGNQTSRVNKMIMQTLGGTIQDDNKSTQGVEFKVLKKIEKKSIIDCDNKPLGQPPAGFPGTHWISLQKILTNEITNKRQVRDDSNVLLNNKSSI